MSTESATEARGADWRERRRQRWAGESGLRWANLVLTATLAAAAIVFLWGSDRGFDLSDEGVYYLGYRHPQEFREGYTQYPRLGAAVFGVLGGNIAAVRVVTFTGLMLSALVFWWGFLSFVRAAGWSPFRTPLSRTNGLLLCLLSILPALSWPPPSLSYNSMAGMGLLVAAGCLLRSLVPARSAGEVLRSLLALAGFAAGVVFLLLVKGSAAVALAFSSVLLILLLRPVPWVQRLWLLAALAAGLAAAVGALFAVVRDLAPLFDLLSGAWRELLAGRGPLEMLLRHAEEFLDLLRRTAVSYNFPLAVAAGLMVAALLRRGRQDVRGRWTWWGVVVFFVILAASGFGKNGHLSAMSHRSGTMLFYAALTLSLFLVAAGSHILRDLPKGVIGWADNAGYIVFLAWTALLPFCGAVGTTHKVHINALLHLTPLFALCALLAGGMDRRLRSHAVTWAVSVLLSVFAFSQFWHGFVREPYRLAAPLTEQRYPTEVGEPASVLKLDGATSQFLKRLRQTLAAGGFQPGGDILGLFDLPGVVFAAGGASPGRLWYFGNYAGEEESNRRLLASVGPDRLRRAWILQTDHDPRVASYLAAAGVQFPAEYEYQTELIHPFRGWSIQVWAPRGAAVQKE